VSGLLGLDGKIKEEVKNDVERFRRGMKCAL
jgi:hypothetical protein